MEQTTLLNAADLTPAKVISEQDFPPCSITAIGNCPIGKGRKYGNSLPARRMSCWRMAANAIYTYQSGRLWPSERDPGSGDVHDIRSQE